MDGKEVTFMDKSDKQQTTKILRRNHNVTVISVRHVYQKQPFN